MRTGLRQKKWALVGLTVLLAALLTVLWRSPVRAQSQFGLPDFRLNQLSSEVAALRLQVNQLQAQIGGRRNPAPDAPASPRIAPTPQLPISPAQFERLATLVIETREEVRAIDDRLRTVEARLPRTAPQSVQPSVQPGIQPTVQPSVQQRVPQASQQASPQPLSR